MKRFFFLLSLLISFSIGQIWATDYYVKVTSAPSDWTGDYLIVYEAGNLAFDGSLSTLDAVGNTKAVTIVDGKIEATAEMNAIKFTMSADASESGWYQLKSASGYYIAGTQKTSNAGNGLKSTNAENSKSNYINQPGVGQILSKSKDQNMTLRYNSATNQTRFRYYKSGQQAIALYKFEAGGAATACATPTFTPTAGAVLSGTTVTLSTTTADADIYYTMGTNPSNPTSTSTKYTAPITITAATTINAIAIKSGLDNSSVATAAYTILEPKTIAQIMPTSSDEGSEFLLNDVTVTYAYGSNVYVKDASGYMLVYSSISGAANGKVLQGLQGKAKLYSGLPEVSTVTKAPTVIAGSAVAPEDLTAYPVDADLNKYVTMEGVTFASAASFSGSVNNVTGSFKSTDLIFRNNFKLSGVSLTAGTPYRVVGIVQKYNTNYQIYPISFEEIVSETQVATPTFSPAAGTYTSVQNVTISCETTGATIHYTTNGDEPTASSPAYSSAIEVGESMTIKAIAVKQGLDDSNVASAAYTINLPLPSHDFQVTHNFTTGEGFEFPTGWGGNYNPQEIAFTDDKIVFAAASKQTGTITDRPVVKEGAISLVLTNSHKLISAVRFDYMQWGSKVPTLTMKYSTDGGATYSNFDPVVSTTDFALQVLDMPEGVNAIQVVGTADKQVGLTSIAFDLENKPVVTKTVTITTPSNGTLVVKNGENAIASGDAVEVGSVLTITATPADGYILTGVTVNGNAYTASTLTLTENVTIAASFEVNQAPLVTSYVLSEIGVETSHLNGERVGDKVNLPLTAATCSKTFVGWDPASNCSSAPTYAPGAEYTLAANNKLYAVYADPVAGSTWDVATSVAAGDVVVISTNTGYTAHDMKTAGAISGTLLGCTASTYNTDKSQITELAEGTLQFTVGGNATNGWTLKNGTKYLAATAVKKVALQDNEATWSIEFSGNTATITYSTTTYGRLQYNYNSGSDRFTTYATDQTAISLYKQAVSYNNYSTACAAAPATLESIAISGTATELEYTEGDEFNPAGLSVTGTYSDESTAPITEGITWAFDPATLSTGTTSVSVTATVSEITSLAFVVNGLTVNAATATTDNVVILATVGAKLYAMSNTAGTDNKSFVPVEVEEDGSNIVVASEADKVAIQWTKTTTGSVTTFQDADNKYLKGTSGGGDLTLNEAPCEWTWDESTDYHCYVTGDRSFIYRGSTYNVFKNYKISNVTNVNNTEYAGVEVRVIAAENIIVTSKADPQLAYDPTSVELIVGGTFTPATLTYATGFDGLASVTYGSNNENLATVAADGTVTLASGKTGTATITATFTGNNSYLAGSASYTIKVKKDLPDAWVLVTNINQIESGMSVIIASEMVDDKIYTMGGQNTSNRAGVESSIDENGVLTPGEETEIFTIGDAGNGTFAIQASNKNYLYASSSSSNQLKEKSTIDANASWSISITNNGTIVTAQGSYTHNLMRFNPNNVSPIFACYLSNTTTGTPVALYIPKPETPPTPTADYTRDVTAGRYGTICLPNGGTINGAKLFDLEYYDGANTLYFLEVNGNAMVAGRPYIFLPSATTIEVTYTDNANASAGSFNGLVGSFTQQTVAIGTGDDANYILYQNAYYLVNSEAYVGANRAYIHMASVPTTPTQQQQGEAPRRRVAMAVNGEQVATGIDAINASDKPMKVMIDGKLYIIRAGQMYDMTGSKVK